MLCTSCTYSVGRPVTALCRQTNCSNEQMRPINLVHVSDKVSYQSTTDLIKRLFRRYHSPSQTSMRSVVFNFCENPRDRIFLTDDIQFFNRASLAHSVHSPIFPHSYLLSSLDPCAPQQFLFVNPYPQADFHISQTSNLGQHPTLAVTQAWAYTALCVPFCVNRAFPMCFLLNYTVFPP